MSDPAYRRTYLGETTRGWILLQLQAIMRDRGWSETDLAAHVGDSSKLSADLENGSQGNFSVDTLLDLASALDVALEIRFVSWPTFFDDMQDASVSAMIAPSFSVEAFASKRS